jgi:hypothetical protein
MFRFSGGDSNGVGSRFRATIHGMESGLPENDSRPGVFNLSHSGLISQFLAYLFPFRDWLP